MRARHSCSCLARAVSFRFHARRTFHGFIRISLRHTSLTAFTKLLKAKKCMSTHAWITLCPRDLARHTLFVIESTTYLPYSINNEDPSCNSFYRSSSRKYVYFLLQQRDYRLMKNVVSCTLFVLHKPGTNCISFTSFPNSRSQAWCPSCQGDWSPWYSGTLFQAHVYGLVHGQGQRTRQDRRRGWRG
jgi:hypothetical protein